MRVGILESGDVEKAFAEGFLHHDHDVMLGRRTRAKLDAWTSKQWVQAFKLLR